MDISDLTTESAVEREVLKVNFNLDEKDEKVRDYEKWKEKKLVNQNPKRSSDEGYINSKKRRKQLKPTKIASNLEDMVEVPKQIIGLNNDVDYLNELSHTVPKEVILNLENNSLSNDVHSRAETPTCFKANAAASVIDAFRSVEKLEDFDLNVPKIVTGPKNIINRIPLQLSFQSVKNSTFWSEAGFKVFNQEAYCDLCKKEFCNKYFLKTHKANKHGIYVDVPASTNVKPQIKLDSIKVIENGKAPNDVDSGTSFCEMCNKKFCNKYFVKRHKNKSHGFPEEEIHSCIYVENENQVVQNAIPKSTNDTNSTLKSHELLTLLSNENDRDNQKQIFEQETPLNLIINSKNEEDDEFKAENLYSEEGEEDEGECSSENLEKLETMLLRLNPSEIDSKFCKTAPEVIDVATDHKCPSEERIKECVSDVNESSSESKIDFSPSKYENVDYAYVNKMEALKQTKPTSSYCEICNKELCNKYFMKTHMQRMHGIEIEHGTQIGGVVCNICNKELCSKYFLRVHKQNTHGIVNPNSVFAPSTSSHVSNYRTDSKTSRGGDFKFTSNFSQVCFICSKRFRSPKWLQAHFISDHGDGIKATEQRKEEIKEEGEETEEIEDERERKESLDDKNVGDPREGLDVISKIFWEKDPTSKTYKCSQCPFITTVLAFLFVHERSHSVLTPDIPQSIKPSASLQNLIHNKTFWQHKITQHVSECLDLSTSKPTCVGFEKNGS